MTSDKHEKQVIRARISQAVETMRKLPLIESDHGAISTVGKVRIFWRSRGLDEKDLCAPPPDAKSIRQLEEVIEWMKWLSDDEVLLVWRRGCGDQWKELMKRFRAGRTSVTDRWNTALTKIAVGIRLNAAQNGEI